MVSLQLTNYVIIMRGIKNRDMDWIWVCEVVYTHTTDYILK